MIYPDGRKKAAGFRTEDMWIRYNSNLLSFFSGSNVNTAKIEAVELF